MLALTLAPLPGRRLEVLCIGAHCDDIEIGCGGTILSLQRRHAICRIHWLVLTSVPSRRREAMAAMRAIVRPSNRGEVHIFDLPDGYLPAHFAAAKRQFEEAKQVIEPDVVFTHHGLDRHQDHNLVSQMTWQTFRNHMILEYEIPKYDGDLVTPNMYVPLSSAVAAKKVDVVTRTFFSQKSKSWFSSENLLAAMRIRGLECRASSGFAEAFHARKFVGALGAGEAAAATPRRRTSSDVTGTGRR